MMIFGKAIPRRMFLRAVGTTLALPLLDAMIPAMAAPAAKAGKSPIRLGIVYVPNGMWPMDRWTPKTEGAGFALTPTLEPLAPFRDQLLVLTGLAQKEALPAPGDAGARPPSCLCDVSDGRSPEAHGRQGYPCGNFDGSDRRQNARQRNPTRVA